MALSLVVYYQGRQVFSTCFDGPIEFGRQQPDEPTPYSRIETGDGARVILANLEEASLSRRQARLVPLHNGHVRVTNLSAAVVIDIDPAGNIEPGTERELTPPAVLLVGERTLRIEGEPVGGQLESLANATVAPGRHQPPSTRLQKIRALGGESDEGEILIQWMYAAMSVFQSAASSLDFLQQAAQAVVHLVDVDSAAVVRWDGKQWVSDAVCHRQGSQSRRWRPSNTILDKARQEKRTFWNIANVHATSLVGVEALVAAPILDANGNVIAALYCDRRQPAMDRDSIDITPLEAMLVELLATGVAAGLARLDKEREAMAMRVRFEQAFTPELVRQVESQPALLSGRDTEITCLFCDVRGFSQYTERLGPVRTFAWISDVLEELSECVHQNDGVLVDYVGDELFAMWGTPIEREDHASLACQAAFEMTKRLEGLNHRWQEELGQRIDLSIGINTGVARVGNTGTKRKFKYGPVGNTVNLASRIQGATKKLESRILISESTAAKLGNEMPCRRVACVRVVNIEKPVALYELVAEATPAWGELRERYQEALDALDRRDFFTATKCLGNLVAEFPDDGPSRILLSRAVNALISPDDFDPVWNFTTK